MGDFQMTFDEFLGALEAFKIFPWFNVDNVIVEVFEPVTFHDGKRMFVCFKVKGE